MYEKFSRWIDTALADGIPSEVAGICFSIYQNSSNVWSVEMVGCPTFSSENNDWACNEITDFNTRTYTFSWREQSEWKRVLNKILALVKK